LASTLVKLVDIELFLVFMLGFCSKRPPTGKQADNFIRHNPRHTKTSKNVISQSGSHITVKKKVVYKFSISLAQVSSVHNDDMHFPEINVM
jgi:hypothetical protein